MSTINKKSKIRTKCLQCGTICYDRPSIAKTRKYCSYECKYSAGHSKEAKQKMIDNHADFSGKNHPGYGSKRSDKSKEKSRQSTLEQFKDGMPEVTIDKIKKAMKGKHSGKDNPFYGQKHTHESKEKQANHGENNGNFINGKTKKRGRWFIWIDEKRVKQSRYVAEQYLKRKLSKEEIVHHINKIIDDDRPKNLYVFSTNSAHARHHGWKITPFLKSNLI